MSDRLGRAQLARAASRFARDSLPPLVLMTDDERLPDPLAAAAKLPRGSMVIVRARGDARRDALTRAMLRLSRHKGFTILVASDPALAIGLSADGMHLSEVRAREAIRWRSRHPAMLITTTVHSFGAALRAQSLPVDAIFLSPVFATRSHSDAKALTPVRANLIARSSNKPVYALGGIDARNVSLLARDAFSGIAAIGALAV